MSVLCQTSRGWFLDHRDAVSRIYRHAQQEMSGQRQEQESKSAKTHYSLRSEMFQLHCPFMMDSHFEKWKMQVDAKSHDQTNTQLKACKRRKKRKLEIEGNVKLNELHERLQSAYTELLAVARAEGYLAEITDVPRDNNIGARQAAGIEGPGDTLAAYAGSLSNSGHPWSSTPYLIASEDKHEVLKVDNVFHRLMTYKGDNPTMVNLDGNKYIVPPNASFVMSDFNQLLSHTSSLQVPGGFNLIVVDPAWQNKSVKRKKSYCSLREEDLLQMPLQNMAAPGCLLVVWVTNKPRLLNFVRDQLFPAWGVDVAKQWHWIKVTVSGSLICDMDSPTKMPYETLLLGRIQKPVGENTPRGDNCDLPDNSILLSVPCSLHSKKPPLMEVLGKYLPPAPRCLEMFARNLWPGWVSWGQEVLKHQHIDYYEEVT